MAQGAVEPHLSDRAGMNCEEGARGLLDHDGTLSGSPLAAPVST
jgi:hypothetical protein